MGNPITCCCGCVFKCVFACILQIVCIVLLIVGAIGLTLYLIFRPEELKYEVTNATLTDFYVSPTNQLAYNLLVDLNLKNPNTRMVVFYDKIEVNAKFEDERFATTFINGFKQPVKNITTVGNLAIKGQNMILLNGKQNEEYKKQRSEGKFNIELLLSPKFKFMHFFGKTSEFKPKAKCSLTVPLRIAGVQSGNFEKTQCKYEK